MYVAFAIAAAIGGAVFGIWWLTSPRTAAPVASSESVPASETASGTPATPARPEPVLPRGGSLRGWTPEPDFEDAHARLTQATLVRVNRSSDEVEPWLAESWTASADNLTYTLKLRPDVRWSDGTPLAAEDVVASISAAQVMGKPLAARAIDPLTIEIRFPEPFAPGLRVLDRHPIRETRQPATGATLGPFMRPASAKATAGQALVRNPHYWRKAPDGSPLPYLDELTLAPRPLEQPDFVDAPVRVDDYEALKKIEQSGKGEACSSWERGSTPMRSGSGPTRAGRTGRGSRASGSASPSRWRSIDASTASRCFSAPAIRSRDR